MSHEGHYGMQHIALWSYTHIPNIIDLSRKSKMLWPRQENTIQKQLFDPTTVLFINPLMLRPCMFENKTVAYSPITNKILLDN